MPVRYASGSEASILSFFFVTPRIIFKLKGSILPSILPQTVITIGLSFAAQESNPIEIWGNDAFQILWALSPLMYVLSYLLVFKTHHGLNEIISAMRIVDQMATACRVIARSATSACIFHELRLSHAPRRREAASGKKGVKPTSASEDLQCCSNFGTDDHLAQQPANSPPSLPNTTQEDLSPAQAFQGWAAKATQGSLAGDNHPQITVRQLTRKIYRLLILYWHVIVEYFLRTGGNATHDVKRQKLLRNAVCTFAAEHEFRALYPRGDENYCNPTVVLYWLKVITSQLALESSSEDLALTQTNATLGILDTNFSLMDDIDKNQFPFPYAQLVKVLTIFFGLCAPFLLEPTCGRLTPLISAFTAIAFFGLDELGEILDSPFGSDPNSVHLQQHVSCLAEDLDTMWSHLQCGTVLQIMSAPENDEDLFSEKMYANGLSRQDTSRLLVPIHSRMLEGIESAVLLGVGRDK